MFRFVTLPFAAALLSGCVIAVDADEYDGNFDLRPSYDSSTSAKSFEATLTDLQRAIDARGFTTFAVIDHAAGASRVGQSLPPATVVIFGNPKGGTPLIRENRRMGLELPLRAMVWQDGDKVRISTTDIEDLANRYDLDGLDAQIDRISDTLDDIRREATGR